MYVFKPNFKAPLVYTCVFLFLSSLYYVNINNGTFELDFNLLIIYFDFIIANDDSF